MLNSGTLRNSFWVVMICPDLERERDLWKINTDRELDGNKELGTDVSRLQKQVSLLNI